MTAKDKLWAWFENPLIPRNACMLWSLRKIAESAGVSTTTVQQHLPKMVATRYTDVDSYRTFVSIRKKLMREDAKRGHALPEKEITRIQKLRKKCTIFETVAETGYSPGTVQKYSSGKYKV